MYFLKGRDLPKYLCTLLSSFKEAAFKKEDPAAMTTSPVAPHLFSPFQLGPLTLPSRIVMAPMTRSRAGAGNVPTELFALYYSQRAAAGLILTEATQVTPEGQGYVRTPGIHSDEQVAGWQIVTDAVHAAGGRIHASEPWHRRLLPRRWSGGSCPPEWSVRDAAGGCKPSGRRRTCACPKRR